MRSKIIKKSLLLLLISTCVCSVVLYPQERESGEDLQKKTVDFGVLEIRAGECACELKGLDVIYFNKIYVKLTNNSDETEDAEVSVSYFDVISSRYRKAVKKARQLKPKEKRWLMVVTAPILARRTNGIHARVYPVYPRFVEDVNSENDLKITRQCIEKTDKKRNK